MLINRALTILLSSIILCSCCCNENVNKEFNEGFNKGFTSQNLLEEGDQLQIKGKYKEAIKKYEDSIEELQSAEAYYKIGLCYEELKEYELALENFQKAKKCIDLDETETFFDPNLKEKIDSKIKQITLSGK